MMLESLQSITLYEIYVLALRSLISLSIFVSLLVSVSRIWQCLKFVYYAAKCKLWKTPIDYYDFATLPEDMHANAEAFPMVAVQLPMFNERAVCQAIIDCSCELRWPRERLMIQVLDDSTDEVTARLVDETCDEWRARGFNVLRRRRTNRQGYKAGALKEGMADMGKYEYIAVFDADFKPDPDFLRQTIPYLMGNSNVGYVQACWTFLNPNESLLTKAQEISLNYHFLCEQWTYFASGSFFNFNGTAGVWRKACIEDVGGWKSRTTVEDMDLSLRAYLAGWQAVFLRHVPCMNELPASFFAYRKQQHRWTCGPVALWKQAATAVFSCDRPLIRKLEVFVMVFGIQKFLCHWVNFGFFCALVPLSIFTPEVNIPLWALVHLPAIVTLSTASFTPKGWYHALVYVLFENAMGIVKTGAAVAGLFNFKRAQEWVVTTKLGSSDARPGTGAAEVRSCKLYAAEACMAVFVLSSAIYGMMFVNRWSFSVFLILQGSAFLAFGLNLVDCNSVFGTYKLFSMPRLLPCFSARKKDDDDVNAPLANKPGPVSLQKLGSGLLPAWRSLPTPKHSFD